MLIAFSSHDRPTSTSSTKSSRLRLSHGDDDPPAPDPPAECVVYTPHGLHAAQLHPISSAVPPLRTLCLIHGLHDVSLPRQQLNLGAHNALKAQRLLRAKYWVATHDEVKLGGGLMSYLLRRKAISFTEALADEARRRVAADADGEERALEDVHFEELANGESRILE